jgi:Zn-finger nucleic acid-binding protein
MREAFFMPHLGLGDHIICNGILRKLRESYDIVHMPVKRHNLLNVQDMFKDDNGIELISVSGDAEAVRYRDMFKGHINKIIGVGNYGQDFLQDSSSFDESFYRQVEMEYSERWKLFSYSRDLDKESALYDAADLPGKYIFVHDDRGRDYEIEDSFFEGGLFVFRPSHQFGADCETTLFHYGKIIENATEIHCIDSSFACYIEHLDCSTVDKMVLHRYIKQEKEFNTQDKNHPFFPQYRQKWEII